MKSAKSTKSTKYELGWIFAQTNGARAYMLLLALSGLLACSANLGIAYILKMFLDIATAESSQTLSFAVVMTLACFASEGLSRTGNSFSTAKMYGNVERKIRERIFDVYFKCDYAAAEKYSSAEMLMRLTEDTKTVSSCMPALIRSVFFSMIMALGALTMMFYINWKMTLVIIVSVPILIFSVSMFSKPLQKTAEKDKQNDENNRVFMQESLSKSILIRTFFLQHDVARQLMQLYKSKFRTAVKFSLWEGFSTFTNNLIGSAMFLIAIGGGSYFIMRGEMGIGDMIAMVQLMNYVVMPFSGISEMVSQVNQAIVSARRIGETLELPVREAPDSSRPDSYIAPNQMQAEIQAIELKDVDFSYVDGQNVLRGLNMRFDANEITAIIGRSGSGKSTVAGILLGLYRQNAGEVSAICDGERVAVTGCSRRFAYLPAGNAIFADTIKYNICLSRGEYNHEKMRECAAKTHIAAFIESLPETYDTVIAENAGTISSGQAQRIAISRVLYHDASVLILDEPTTNLDLESIAKLHQTVREVAKGKICIIITHEENTVDIADKIYQIQDGVAVCTKRRAS